MTATKAMAQANHDTRARKPSYLEAEPDAMITTWRRIDDTWERYTTKRAESTALKGLLKANAKWQDDLYHAKHGRKRHPNAKPFLSGIITFTDPSQVSPEALRQTAEEYVWTLAETYGTAPLYMAEHRDEKTPHFHFVIPNIDDDGMSIRRKINRAACRAMQDLVAETFAPLGFVRGESVDLPRRHYSVREGHRREMMELARARAERNDIVTELAVVRDRVEELRADVERLAQEKKVAEQELKARKDERKAIVKETQRLVVDAEERKAVYRRFDAETKRLRAEVKIRTEALAGLEQELMQGEVALQRVREGLEALRREEATVEREEAVRAVICGLAETSAIPATVKERILGEIETRWPSSIPVSVWQSMANEVSAGLERDSRDR
jgi:hypothetical protein